MVTSIVTDAMRKKQEENIVMTGGGIHGNVNFSGDSCYWRGYNSDNANFN
jgi:hypothetical protein